MPKTVRSQRGLAVETYPAEARPPARPNRTHTPAEIRAALTRALIVGDLCRSHLSCAHASTVAVRLDICESTTREYLRSDPAIEAVDAMSSETLNPVRGWTFAATRALEEAGRR